jgi:4-hydroxy-tetrahydrodipicolinate reductase
MQPKLSIVNSSPMLIQRFLTEMKIAIIGYGKMGKLIDRLAPEYGFDVSLRLNRENNGNGQGFIEKNFEGVSVAIEFSNALAAPENIERAARLGANIVTGTTGWFGEIERARKAAEKRGVGIVWGSNYSVGIQIFGQMVSQAARLMRTQEEYESWAWEIHHAAKKDAPSGTLLALVEKMKEANYDRRIDVNSNRAGQHHGTHEIGFDSGSDTITLRHVARNRECYARGALRAARWVVGKKGFFDFRDIFGQLR